MENTFKETKHSYMNIFLLILFAAAADYGCVILLADRTREKHDRNAAFANAFVCSYCLSRFSCQ